MTFADLNLNTPLLDALNDAGFTEPTTIQHKAFSIVMSGEDVVGIAQTGTGKTLAYLLPYLRMWRFSDKKTPLIVVLVPTRELVVQVLDEIERLTKYMSITAVGIYGGTNIKTQITAVNKGADILVATPGRLIDLAMKGVVKLKLVKKLVIDEVDEMLDLGFRTQLKTILDLLPPKRQNIAFSATMTEEVSKLINDYFKEPTFVEAAPTGTPLASIRQWVYAVPNFNTKVNLLKLFLADKTTMTKVLVFAATKQLADQLFDELSEDFEGQLGIIHSNKSQNHRFDAVRQFQAGTHRILIATDLVARGIDVAAVSHVFNFDIPDVAESYIHRIGRTGRADKQGEAISFFTPKEQDALSAIETLMDYRIPLQKLPEELAISTELTQAEIPVPYQPNMNIKAPTKIVSGPAFHEKIAKNKKVNVKIRHADKMRAKYGKPLKRKAKK